MQAGVTEVAMDSVLKRLETQIDQLVKAYGQSSRRVAELEARVAELEGEAREAGRAAELERQRDELRARLEKVLAVVDSALEGPA